MSDGYNSVTSERLHEVVAPALGNRMRLETEVAEVTPGGIVLANGERIDARAVIDGRGDPGGDHLNIAFQKFLGLFVRLAEPHGLKGPILMDATVEQTDGYRFVYTLPFSDTEALIEDTYYADEPDLDHHRLRKGIEEYAKKQGWVIAAITGTPEGSTPTARTATLSGSRASPMGAGAQNVHPSSKVALKDHSLLLRSNRSR